MASKSAKTKSEKKNYTAELETAFKSVENTSGKLLIAGLVQWEETKKKLQKDHQVLFAFHRFTTENYRFAVSSCKASHSVLINMDWKALTFGRNNMSQLGHPTTQQVYETPTLVEALEGLKIVSAACGSAHTLFLTDDGDVYACGKNNSGQCGVGKTSSVICEPTKIQYDGAPIVKVCCGAEFSAILDVNGNLFTFGLPEFGQLGHGSDGKYFITSSKMSFRFETKPRLVEKFVRRESATQMIEVNDVKIVDFACGANHTVAIDSEKRVFSWGFGGYGRLGHNSTKDEAFPCLIGMFSNLGIGGSKVYCGAQFSFVISDHAVPYFFGTCIMGKEATMYPKTFDEIAGWNIADIGCGHNSTVISADDSLVVWGGGYGELGLGNLQKSTRALMDNPHVKGMKIPVVTMGFSHTLMLVNTDDPVTKEKYDSMEEYIVE